MYESPSFLLANFWIRYKLGFFLPSVTTVCITGSAENDQHHTSFLLSLSSAVWRRDLVWSICQRQFVSRDVARRIESDKSFLSQASLFVTQSNLFNLIIVEKWLNLTRRVSVGQSVDCKYGWDEEDWWPCLMVFPCSRHHKPEKNEWFGYWVLRTQN